jgi:Domain of unknown function (DUF4160)
MPLKYRVCRKKLANTDEINRLICNAINLTKALRFCAIMPSVDVIDGLRVVIYPNDHRPAHVHVIGSGCEAVFNLHCPEGPPE